MMPVGMHIIPDQCIPLQGHRARSWFVVHKFLNIFVVLGVWKARQRTLSMAFTGPTELVCFLSSVLGLNN